jgi:hypothetical protein
MLFCRQGRHIYLAWIRFFLGVHSHVGEQLVLGVERGQFTGTVLECK